MNKVKNLMFALVVLTIVSCTSDPAAELRQSSADDNSHKIVNSAMYAGEGSLLIYVDERTMAALDAAEGIGCGIPAMDEVLHEIGATSVNHAIDLTLNADRKREYGLDRWYVVNFPTSVAVDVAARKLASVASVARVQYNTQLSKPTSEVVIADVEMLATTRSTDAVFDDPLLELQWHYINTGNQALFEGAVEGADINAAAAWNIEAGRREVIVAVVDEGIDYAHPDLKDNMWVNDAEFNGEPGVDDDANGFVDDIYGYNFVPGTGGVITWDKPSVDPDVEGDIGHGTHVAGTVAAVNNNSIGVAGVAGGSGNGDGVRLMSCQIFSQGLLTNLNTSAQAIVYAADMGASVLQNSWGYPGDAVMNDYNYRRFYSIEYNAIQYFVEKSNCAALDGGVVVFAAGNESKAHSDYPAAYVDYIGVTAIAADGLPAYYTNYDKGCNVAAPGGELRINSSMTAILEEGGVFSTMPNNQYGYMQGTSMACPHVSGIAALALSYALDMGITLTVDQLQTILLTSVNDLDSKLGSGTRPNPEGGVMQLKNYKGKMGSGAIDAYRVLMGVRGTYCCSATVGEETEIDLNTILGDGNLSLTMLKDVEISDEAAAELGIEDNPAVFSNKAYITCTKPGCAIVTFHVVAGGGQVGSDDSAGGMDIPVEVALIARSNNYVDGWL